MPLRLLHSRDTCVFFQIIWLWNLVWLPSHPTTEIQLKTCSLKSSDLLENSLSLSAPMIPSSY